MQIQIELEAMPKGLTDQRAPHKRPSSPLVPSPSIFTDTLHIAISCKSLSLNLQTKMALFSLCAVF